MTEEEGVHVLLESRCWGVQQLVEADVPELIGAEPGERWKERLAHRKRLPGEALVWACG